MFAGVYHYKITWIWHAEKPIPLQGNLQIANDFLEMESALWYISGNSLITYFYPKTSQMSLKWPVFLWVPFFKW